MRGERVAKLEINRGVRRYFCAPTATDGWETNGPIPGDDSGSDQIDKI
jgi:hypothetical protein